MTKPIPFAVRKPIGALMNLGRQGEGIALWFGCDDADALHALLLECDIQVVFAPKEVPFGRYFVFRDPFGDTITPHTVRRSCSWVGQARLNFQR